MVSNSCVFFVLCFLPSVLYLVLICIRTHNGSVLDFVIRTTSNAPYIAEGNGIEHCYGNLVM